MCNIWNILIEIYIGLSADYLFAVYPSSRFPLGNRFRTSFILITEDERFVIEAKGRIIYTIH